MVVRGSRHIPLRSRRTLLLYRLHIASKCRRLLRQRQKGQQELALPCLTVPFDRQVQYYTVKCWHLNSNDVSDCEKAWQ